MGLKFSEDLDAWRKWQESRAPFLRRVKGALMPRPDAQLHLATSVSKPQILVVLDAPTPSQISAYLAPVLALDGGGVAVLSATDVASLLPNAWSKATVLRSEIPTSLTEVRVVFASGHFLPASSAAYAWSRKLGSEFVVAQHGLLTPFQPPLPEGAHLLAFSESDGEFWKSGRSDIEHVVVGSQMLWESSAAAARESGSRAKGPPVFLGQLHGAELPRALAAETAEGFCLGQAALYRPHPSETDRKSRQLHNQWKKRGVQFESSGLPLRDLRGPVVSVFSTGVLEAAASGQDAWVTCVNAPDWVLEFWSRYGLSQWGEEPTPAPPVPQTEPAQSIAASLARILEGTA